jgi:hypothetical protein
MKLIYHILNEETGETTEPQEIKLCNGMRTEVIEGYNIYENMDMGIVRNYRELYQVRYFNCVDVYKNTNGNLNHKYEDAIKRQLVINGERQVKFPNQCNGIGGLKLPEEESQKIYPFTGTQYGKCHHCNGKGCVVI